MALMSHRRKATSEPLCYNNELKSMEDLNLKNYEVSPIEILHDLNRYMHNILKVVPEILSDPVKVNKI